MEGSARGFRPKIEDPLHLLEKALVASRAR